MLSGAKHDTSHLADPVSKKPTSERHPQGASLLGSPARMVRMQSPEKNQLTNPCRYGILIMQTQAYAGVAQW